MSFWALFAALCLILFGCSEPVVTKNLTVYESAKDRTNEFTYYYDGERWFLNGTIIVQDKEHPVMLYYDKEKSIVFRQGGECIAFERPDKVLFGFVPPLASEGANDYTVQKELNIDDMVYNVILDKNSRKVESRIVFHDGLHANEDDRQMLDTMKTTKCIKEEDYVFNV